MGSAGRCRRNLRLPGRTLIVLTLIVLTLIAMCDPRSGSPATEPGGTAPQGAEEKTLLG
jgi:hypothetical protein